MSMMQISLKILETNNEIAVQIAKSLIPDIKNYMDNAMKNIKNNLPAIIYKAVINSPEYVSITQGQLKYEFGIPDGASKINGLLEIWSNSIYTTYVPPSITTSGSIKTSFDISMVKADFSNVLGTDYANVYDQKRGYSLPWLKWLLLEGSVPIVKNHQVVIGRSSRSRTGMALMRESSSKSWGVPGKFAGTETDNWITRAIDSSASEIKSLIEKALQ